MGIGYYDFDGEPIELEEWSQLFEARGTDPGLVRWQVGFDDVDDVHISTVWIGIDHRFGDGGPPLIFETRGSRAGNLSGTWRAAYSGSQRFPPGSSVPETLGAVAVTGDATQFESR